jgi:hypothetical protein
MRRILPLGSRIATTARLHGTNRRSLFEARLRLERLEDRLVLAMDFGDAPAPYFTTLAENGARHEAIGPQLGASRDTEADGAHSAEADGDGADDDGVTFGRIQVGQLDATITVNVQNAPQGARFDAWIDFNADGSWGGPREQICNAMLLIEGDNTFGFDVPSTAFEGRTLARFRLSTLGNLGIRGLASDGEVEDHVVTLISSDPASGVFVGRSVIDTTAQVRHVFAADMDRDGDMDILAAVGEEHRIHWYENDGSQRFTVRTVSTQANYAWTVSAADIDGDGDLDILSSLQEHKQLVWFENDGAQSFTQRLISTTANTPRSVIAADVDGDGDTDVVAASGDNGNGRVDWYSNNGSQEFVARPIRFGIGYAENVSVADVDSDGDVDVLSASAYQNNPVAWYENNGSQSFTYRPLATALDYAKKAIPADLDKDGDIDVLVPMLNEVRWYENNGAQTFTPLAIITTDFGYQNDAIVVDIDGDGDLDIVTQNSGGPPKVTWHDNDGNLTFTARVIADVRDYTDVFVADVDSDGDLDVLSADQIDKRLSWYRNLNFDFGDAPALYPTALVENGARHEFGGPQLGATRDQDRDGAHSVAAEGAADDDGVTFGSIRVGQLDATLMVHVQNAVPAARLDAWIDFDGDGAWGGAMEQIANDVAVFNGDNVIEFDVPSWAADGETFARFRLSTEGNLGVRGSAADGEVEDYAVTIAPPATALGDFSGENVIDPAADGALSVHAADIEGDGDMDILSASFSGQVVWYENDGGQSFNVRPLTPAPGANGVLAVDMNTDGDMDVITASYYGDTIVLYENNGAQSFTTRTVGTADGIWGLHAADIDGDGDTDILSASRDDSTIAWYSNSGSQTFSKRVITDRANGAYSVFAADVDGDGDLDVLSASLNDDKIAWYENNGSQAFMAHTISAFALAAQSVFAADVDGDGDTDVLSASRGDDKIAWYENDGNQSFTAHTISTAAELARSVFAADLDGDGDTDVLSASSGDDKVAWYENDGNQAFTARTISIGGTNDGASRVFAADVDGDGDLDVIAGSNRGDKITWYENSPGLLGDLNRDDRVDRSDAAILAGNYGRLTDAALAQGDLNGDGAVDAADLMILQANFGAVAPLVPAPSAATASRATGADCHAATRLTAKRRQLERATGANDWAAADDAVWSLGAPAGVSGRSTLLRARRA